jgi:phosphoribosylanthranilate isomerase
MLDAFDEKNRGGTGRTIDWSIARRTRELAPRLFLAGGLSSENVGSAIAAVAPYAVDACSALESAPGKKDPQRVRSFIQAALTAE